ncbi:CASP8 protein, partial [Amia calva]|nr:CASP8 protein [Amia calva]
MSSQPRGYCLIFNNSNFLQLKPRSGTHKDAEALDKVFTWLGFEVNTFHDLKADEMHARLKEYGEMSHEGKDCLVCCVLSHGELQCVFGTDDQKVTIKEIISFFDGRNCPSLLQKPKVFFIQACQGEKMQEAVRVQADGGDVHPGLEADLKCHNMIPINADVLLGMATVQECLSLRHTETGSWYIQSLCMQLKESCPRKEDTHTILKKVNEEVSKKSAFLKKQLAKQIPEPRQMLYDLSENITTDDLKNAKFLLQNTLPKCKLEDNMSMLKLLLEMEKADHLDENNLETLEKVIQIISPSLMKKISKFKNEKKLVKVFEWLGFETERLDDCNRLKILDTLKQYQEKDHSTADCFVCCVLSHGQRGEIYGVDGRTVPIKDFTSPFSGIKCLTLREKPKIFFIQACQGDREQLGFSLETDGHSEGLSTDAYVPKNSIPNDSDFLLGMATVDDYVSFRDKLQGSWYIQTLCENLQLLVPRGEDLLSILTKVNMDVSKKSDKLGMKKQIPQPAYSLRKKVIFPKPVTPPPLL